MTAPETFVAALAKYDARLRVRWGARTKKWVIERRMAERSPTWLTERPNPYKSPRGLDLLDGWKDGYVCVMFVDPSLLVWPVVEKELHAADIAMQGSWQAISRKIDEENEAWEKETDRNISNWSEAAADEAWNRLAWLDGRRVSTADPSEAEGSFLEEQRDGFTVRSRRSTDLAPIHDGVD